MSSSLVWKPVVYPSSHYLSDEIKFIFRKKYSDSGAINIRLDRTHIPFLEGILYSASENARKDAEKLIDLINKNDEIVVMEEY